MATAWDATSLLWPPFPWVGEWIHLAIGLQLKGSKLVANMSTYKEQWMHLTRGYCTSDAMPAGTSLQANTGTWRKLQKICRN